MDFISILHGDVLLAKQRPWEGRKSGHTGQLCGQVVEFMSVYGTDHNQSGLFSLVRQSSQFGQPKSETSVKPLGWPA